MALSQAVCTPGTPCPECAPIPPKNTFASCSDSGLCYINDFLL
jgi:hypothetical protein